MNASKQQVDRSRKEEKLTPLPIVPATSKPEAAGSKLFPAARKLRPQFARRLAKLADECPAGDAHTVDRPDLATALLQDALDARASDIHLEPEARLLSVRLRIDGLLLDVAELPVGIGRCLTNQFKALANLDPVARFFPKDSHFRFSENGRSADFRLALVPSHQGEALSIRVLDPARLERAIDDLGLTGKKLRELQDWLETVNGMFLAAGPTGSGKTTTLYALLHELKFADRRIISIEDPVEYSIPGITQVELDEKHHLTFTEGVRAALRLDPDFVMMGEIRDALSAHAAVDAAITGRVLLSTVHSRDAVGAITALRNWGLPDHEIAESLTVVVAQRLVRKLCAHCKAPASPTRQEIEWLSSLDLELPKDSWIANGCERCSGLGYSGRTGIFELWRLTEEDYQQILNHADEHALRRQFHRSQRNSLVHDGLAKVIAGVTSLAELKKAAVGVFPATASSVPPRRKISRRRSKQIFGSERSYEIDI